jgi:hypothetical protein
MALFRLTWDFLWTNICYSDSSSIHSAATNFHHKTEEGWFDFFSMHSLKMPVHKIHFAFICFVEFVNHLHYTDTNGAALLHLVLVMWTGMA